MTDLEDIKRLSPEERIKRLRQLEIDRKDEIKEAEKMIKEAENDLKNKSIIEEIEVPSQDKKDITELFASECDNLEDTVKESEVLQDVQGVQYQIPKAVEDEIKDIYNQLTTLGYNPNWSEDEFNQFYNATDRLHDINNQFEEKLTSGYTISENVTNQLVSSQNVEYNIKKYREFGK